MNESTIPEELTIADAAERYGVNRRTLQKATERGDIPGRKLAGIYLVDAEAVRLFAAIRKARTELDDYQVSNLDRTADR